TTRSTSADSSSKFARPIDRRPLTELVMTVLLCNADALGEGQPRSISYFSSITSTPQIRCGFSSTLRNPAARYRCAAVVSALTVQRMTSLYPHFLQNGRDSESSRLPRPDPRVSG